VWALEKLYYYLDGCEFEVITDCAALRSLIGMKTPSRHMMRWQIAIQEWQGLMTIIHCNGLAHKNADGLLRWALPNTVENPAADLSVDTDRDVPIMAIPVSNLKDKFCNNVKNSYTADHNTTVLLLLLRSKDSRPDLVNFLQTPWKAHFEAGRFILLNGLLYHCTNNRCALVLVGKQHIACILTEYHNNATAGHFSADRTLERVSNLAWWPG
jgi:hypothetical protein